MSPAKQEPETKLDLGGHVHAKATMQQWLAIIVGFGAAIISGYTMLADARSMAKQALELANQAVQQTTAVQTKLEGALVDLGTKLGRIEGLLEAMRSERGRQ